MSAIVTLTTDFGLADAYVAAMKGVILGINPEAKLIDICHTIRPQNIQQAAFVLGTAYQFFPQRTIHLVVVDPGVGTERRAIILRTAWADFVAPDNGVLGYVIQQSSDEPAAGRIDGEPVGLGAGLEAVAVTNPRFWRSPVSPTFHGRDIFAPVAAWLSRGLSPADFGQPVTSITMLPLSCPHQAPDGTLIGHVIHIDGFGNLITDIKADNLPQPAEEVTIEIGGRSISELSRTYAEGEGLLALVGSSGYLEVALREGSAGALLHSEIGTEVRIRPQIGGDR